jgi:hypothetical protein
MKVDVQWVSLIWHKYYQNVVPHLAREKGSFWWRDILRLHVLYRGVAVCSPSRGDTVAFWEDIINGALQSEIFPNLVAYAKDPKASLWKLRNEGSLINCFNIPMSRAAYNELLLLQQFFDSLHVLDLCEKDSWHFIWGQQIFTLSKYYQYQYKNLQPSRVVLSVWKSKCTPTVKFFFWLLLNDRLNTRNVLRRRRKFLEEGYSCVLCQDGIEETSDHLFFECYVVACRWFALGISWSTSHNSHQKIYLAKQAFPHPFFMEIFMITAWCIWNERNRFIFSNKPPGFSSWKLSFKEEVLLHMSRIKSSLHQSIIAWLEAL